MTLHDHCCTAFAWAALDRLRLSSFLFPWQAIPLWATNGIGQVACLCCTQCLEMSCLPPLFHGSAALAPDKHTRLAGIPP